MPSRERHRERGEEGGGEGVSLLPEKGSTSVADDGTEAVNVHKRVLRLSAEKTTRNLS